MSIKIENVQVVGFEPAVRGMRNPLNSWDKSDSHWDLRSDVVSPEWFYSVGDNDLDLMKRLSTAGNDHAKYERFIDVYCDITAPFYLWKELETYRIGVEKNSCSTMHKIHSKEFTLEDFSHDHLTAGNLLFLETIIKVLNYSREAYLNSKDKEDWWQMIQLLPSSYNQRRTCKISYQALKSMYFARRNHKLDEWREFCAWCETLPYFKEIFLSAAGGENE